MSQWLPWLVGVAAVLLTLAGGVTARNRRGRGTPPTKGPRPGPPPRPRGTRPPRGTTSPRGTTRQRGATPATAPTRQRGGSRTATVQPRPGEIWWADVPYEDGSGSKVRPCLVLRSGNGGVEVLKITSQDKSDRTDHVRIPTREWDPSADHDSFLDLTDPIRVAPAAFEDRAGTCDGPLWAQVRKLHGVTR
ncbi:type II toxin-antitoxin system PemK/MazF family toxin [Micromonospora sp. NPDC049679]|uniref:type II toxin-antitoxin system PemK/MazF family toxin n=1 Tax=Micromonospora sp. NPDC049679 TaxID=3155920 RepID=UPI0033E73626